MSTLIQIVPCLAPVISGVGDYALILARGLSDKYGWVTTFVLCDSEREQDRLDGFKIVPLSERSSDALASALGFHDRVLLHYVGYGYQKRGCPLWLLNGLELWKNGAPHRHLVIMFHELYAFGPPWRSSFWTHPIQRWIFFKLARLCDAAATNRRSSCNTLSSIRKWPATYLPVFSNIGKIEVPDQAIVEPKLALFGSASWRKIAVKRDFSSLVEVCRKLGITEILDIGPEEVSHPEISGVRWNQLGVLEVEQVSLCLQMCIAGFVSYPSHCFGKSTIISAYLSHGLPTIVPDRCRFQDSDGLREGSEFFIAEKLPSMRIGDWLDLRVNILECYDKRSSEVQFGRFDKLIKGEAIVEVED